jgi:tripartite-type tricarboxylate transporter receptor subunit TctC
MKLPHRRKFLHLAAGAAALPAMSRIARAQTYPTRPLRFIVGYTPGGAADIIARIIGQWLSARLGQAVIIENRPGAGSNISVQAALSMPADGYTLLLVSATQAINASLYETLPFDYLRDFAPVALLAQVPYVMVVNPLVPAKTVAEFIAYARTNPKLSMASFGTATGSHLAGELFKAMAGVNLTHIPYRGSAPAVSDLIGGQVQVMFDTVLSSLPHIRSSALRALAVAQSTRFDLLPDVPTVSETLPGFEAAGFDGVAMRGETSPEIVERLNREVNAGLGDATIRARFAEIAVIPRRLSPAEFGNFVTAETEKWAKVVKLSGAKPE